MGTKQDEAIELALRHYELEDGLSHVYRVLGPEEDERKPSEPIKLLEVNEATVPSGFLPIYFGPSRASGTHSTFIIMEVTPEEFGKLRDGETTLPHSWRLGDLIPKPTAVEI